MIYVVEARDKYYHKKYFAKTKESKCGLALTKDQWKAAKFNRKWKARLFIFMICRVHKLPEWETMINPKFNIYSIVEIKKCSVCGN